MTKLLCERCRTVISSKISDEDFVFKGKCFCVECPEKAKVLQRNLGELGDILSRVAEKPK